MTNLTFCGTDPFDAEARLQDDLRGTGAADVIGIANAAATVTVNSQAAYRRGEYFQNAAAISNGSGPVYPTITVSAVNGGSSSSSSGSVLLPAATECFGHDLDGNLTADGLWTYTWDAENRLIGMQSLAAVPLAANKKFLFEYDSVGRRIAKTVYTWNGSGYVWQSQTKFIYDGWNLIGEFDSSNSMLRTYSWGLDLAGSLQGAGGVGGLIGVVTASSATYFPAYVRMTGTGTWPDILQPPLTKPPPRWSMAPSVK